MADLPTLPSTLVVIRKYSDMSDRPRFIAKLDPRAHKLHAVLGEYTFDQLISCGLSSCRQDHKHGVLVVTEDGTETNLGHICGARHFPDQFGGAHKEFRARQQVRANLEAIREYKEGTANYSATINELLWMPMGGRWADDCVRAYSSSCPLYIKNRLLGMARSGNWTITREILVDRENALGLGFRRDDLTETEILNSLTGGEALAGNVRQILLPIRVKISEYASVDPTRLSARKRLEWSAWAATVPPAIETARNLIHAARAFFATENLEKLQLMVRDKHERRGVKRLIAAIEAISHRTDQLAG